MSSGGNGFACALVGLGMSAVWFLASLKQYSLLKKIEYTPTAKIVAAAPGTCEVEGKAVRGAQLLDSPYRHKPCVYYHTVLSYWSGSGKHRHKNTALNLRSSEPFLLSDGTGLIQIDTAALGKGAPAELKKDESQQRASAPSAVRDALGMSFTASIKGLLNPAAKPKVGKESAPLTPAEENDAMLRFVAEHCPKLRGYHDRIELEETYIEENDALYVMAHARAPLEGEAALTPLVLGQKKDGFFYLTEGGEKQARKQTGRNAYLGLGIAPLVFAGSGALLSGYVGSSAVLTLAAAVAVLMYAWAALVHALELYNGMVVLRNQIDSARSNLSALYQRRLDLIPRLAGAVKAARAYEAGVQEELARLRADAGLSANKTFIAISENYPALAADQNFVSLQHELERTEEWIAASRAYVLDSITLYNTKIQQFPQTLFVSFAGFKPIALEYDAPGPASSAPDSSGPAVPSSP